jgi:hypothetical protein
LFGRPTLEHNFETLYWVRDIVQKGPQWFSSFGRNGRKGLRSFSVSGRVQQPGVKLAPAGISVRELIDEYCGGMAEGHSFYGYLPGGASGGGPGAAIPPAAQIGHPLAIGQGGQGRQVGPRGGGPRAARCQGGGQGLGRQVVKDHTGGQVKALNKFGVGVSQDIGQGQVEPC